MDEDVFNRVLEAIRTEGIESWRTKPASYFLGDKYNPDDFKQVSDTLEVWFDSACSHHYVLEKRDYILKAQINTEAGFNRRWLSLSAQLEKRHIFK